MQGHHEDVVAFTSYLGLFMTSLDRFSFPRRTSASSSGFSLLETLLVLGIAAAIVIAAFAIYPKIQSARRTDQETQNIASISASAVDLFKDTGSYGGISNTMLLQAGSFPSNMIAANGSTVTNVWGSPVSVVASPSLSRGFQIQESGVPPAECMRLVPAVEAGFDVVTVNGVIAKNGPTTSSFSISTTLTQACNAGGAAGVKVLLDRH